MADRPGWRLAGVIRDNNDTITAVKDRHDHQTIVGCALYVDGRAVEGWSDVASCTPKPRFPAKEQLW